MLCTDVPFGILVVFYLIYAAGTDSCRQLYIWFVVSSSCVWTRKLLCLEEQILRSFFFEATGGDCSPTDYKYIKQKEKSCAPKVLRNKEKK